MAGVERKDEEGGRIKIGEEMKEEKRENNYRGVTGREVTGG